MAALEAVPVVDPLRLAGIEAERPQTGHRLARHYRHGDRPTQTILRPSRGAARRRQGGSPQPKETL
jgi:hypothetical protein